MTKKREKKATGENPTVTREFRTPSGLDVRLDPTMPPDVVRLESGGQSVTAVNVGPVTIPRALTDKPGLPFGEQPTPVEAAGCGSVDALGYPCAHDPGHLAEGLPHATISGRQWRDSDYPRLRALLDDQTLADAREVAGERVEPTPAEAAQDAAVGETLRPRYVTGADIRCPLDGSGVKDVAADYRLLDEMATEANVSARCAAGHLLWVKVSRVSGSGGEFLVVQAAKDVSVAAANAKPTPAGKFTAIDALYDAGMLAPPTQALEVDADPLSEADRRLIARLESAYAEDMREVVDLREALTPPSASSEEDR